MSTRKYSLLWLLCASQIYGMGYVVTVLTDTLAPPVQPTNTLRGALQAATGAGDTITFSVAGTITLAGPLPPILNAITITGPITIDGAAAFPGLAVAVGTGVSLNDLTIQNTNSLGGSGGNGFNGGGGGAGGGGALYIHNGTTVTANNCKFTVNKATGGAGGNGQMAGMFGSGGGGGGFGGGNGGAGGLTIAGGGGGGHAGGGAGGSTLNGGDSLVPYSFSGGGGASSAGMGGNSGSNPVFPGAIATAGQGGGGGGGAGATPPIPVTGGGVGGNGILPLASYGTGGGGGGASMKDGGAGFGTTTGSGGGGGGGNGVSVGGAGGTYGGGGGGGTTAGGAGGVGGGGGGGTTGTASNFGGGTGGSVTAGTGGVGGGGGAGLGGAVFIQQGGTLTISETVASSFVLQGNSTVGGAAGTGVSGTGVTAATAGKNLGNDFFLTSGGLLVFSLLENYEIASNIESNQAGSGASTGLTWAPPVATTVLTLSGVNTYTGTTTINNGILKVNADTGLGSTTTSITFLGTTGTLQSGGIITSARSVNLTGNGTFDTPTGTSMSFSGTVSGAGILIKTSPGSLELSGPNSYSGGSQVKGGTLTFGGSSNTPLGSGQVTLFDGTTLQVGSDYTSAGTINNALFFSPPQNGQTTIDAQADAKWGGIVSGTAPFNKTGPGTFTLTNAGNTFIGNININGGTLGATSDQALGNSSNQIFINGATFQAAGSFSTPRAITLTGAASIEVLPTFTLTANGVISGSGSLTKTNSGTLLLQPTTGGTANLYLGGTTIAGGVLQVFADSALGDPGGTLTIQTATFQPMASFTSNRPVSIAGAAIIDTQGFQLTLAGVMSGSGPSVEKKGSGTLILTGTNTYANTFIITAGTLQGSSFSILGSVQDNGTLIFNQPSDGVYNGTLSGSGTFIKTGSGKVNFTADSSGFQGSVFVNGGNLDITGKLGGSNTTTVNSGGTLSGTGQVANVIVASGGALSPGDPTGILSINGTLNLNAGSSLDTYITPTTDGLASVASTTTISSGSTVTVIPATNTGGFYGVKAAYIILRGPTIIGTFGSVTSTNPNFIPSLSYPTIFDQNGNKLYSAVRLDVIITEPFLGFQAGNKNERAVANNINALGAAGTLLSDTALFNALETLTGQTTAVINAALDQMHPAQYSAVVELQNAVSSQLVSLFHRKPTPVCYCANPVRIWIEPYGNWDKQKPRRMQVGFNSRTQGIALGFDGKIFDQLVLGIGAAWDYKHLSWSLGRGKASGEGWLAGIYCDYTTNHYYFGFSCLGGLNNFHSDRHIRFATVPNTNPDEVIPETASLTPINKHARSNFDTLNLIGQASTAFMFGPSKCCFFPYLNADIFYSDTRSIREKDAPGLNLIVDPVRSMTFRSEAGMGLQVQDSNYTETMCISPQVLLGWAMEAPLFREKYKSRFEGQTIPFRVEGWDTTWQLFTVDFGLTFTYYCYSFAGAYHLEFQPDNHSSLFTQRCNFRAGFTW